MKTNKILKTKNKKNEYKLIEFTMKMKIKNIILPVQSFLFVQIVFENLRNLEVKKIKSKTTK